MKTTSEKEVMRKPKHQLGKPVTEMNFSNHLNAKGDGRIPKEVTTSLLERISYIHETGTRIESTLDGMSNAFYGKGELKDNSDGKIIAVSLEDTSADALEILRRIETKLEQFRTKIYG